MLRQEIEKILSFHSCEFDGRICSDMTLDKYEERPSCERCRTDRICEAIGKTAEGMPRLRTQSSNCLSVREIDAQNEGTGMQYSKCQAYWQKELERRE